MDLTGVTVTDALAPGCDNSLGTLLAGAMTSYGCSLVNVTSDFTNTADASGTPPVGPNVSDQGTADVVVGPAPIPALGWGGLVLLAGLLFVSTLRRLGGHAH